MTPQPTPENLLRQIAGGCRQSFASLYDAYSGALFGIALGITRNRCEAEDILQEAFLKIWHRAGQYDPNLGKASSWITHLTRNLAIDRLRMRQRRDKLLLRALEEPTFAAPNGSPPNPLIAAETARSIRTALAALPSDQKRALELAFFHGLTQTEIADALQEPLGTIKSRIRRAMERVRLLLDE